MLVSLIEHLSKQGHDVYLWCNQESLEVVAKPFCKKTRIYKQLPPFGFFEHGFKAIELLRRFSSLISNGWKLMGEWSPDLVVCSGLAPSQWMSHCANFKGTPFVIQLHSNPLAHSRASSFGHSAFRIFGVSNFVLSGFRADGMNPQRCITIPNGINVADDSLSKDQARTMMSLPSGVKVITAIGALVDFKRYDIAIEAVIKCNERLGIPMRLLVVGDGPLKEWLMQKYQHEIVEFLGWRSDVSVILAASDFLLSTSEREAFGLTIIEAAALGRPSIISSTGGQADVVVDGKTGLHFSPCDVDECSRKIEQLIVSPDLLETLALGARARYLEYYTEGTMTSRVELEIRSALDEYSSGSRLMMIFPFRGLFLCVRLVIARIFRRRTSFE